MEPLVTTRQGQWAEVEILQWMERHTMIIMKGLFGEYITPSNSTYHSKRKINELLGLKENLR